MTSEQLQSLFSVFSKAGKSLPSLLSVIVLIVLMLRPIDGSDKLDTIIKKIDEQDKLIEAAATAAKLNGSRLDGSRNRNNCQIRTLDALIRKSDIQPPCQLEVAD